MPGKAEEASGVITAESRWIVPQRPYLTYAKPCLCTLAEVMSHSPARVPRHGVIVFRPHGSFTSVADTVDLAFDSAKASVER